MFKTVEERLTELEFLVEKQAFQIRLLQNIIVDPNKLKLYNAILNTNMRESTFHALRKLTKDYELCLEQDLPISFGDFLRDFEKILTKDCKVKSKPDLSSLVPLWLGGSSECTGYSKKLHAHFYK
ncbi:hypothetical protein AAFN87_03950 [Solibacillus sp. CAU 1738]